MKKHIIFDGNGCVLATKYVQPGLSTINCAALNSGMYFVNVKIGDCCGIKQLVKR